MVGFHTSQLCLEEDWTTYIAMKLAGLEQSLVTEVPTAVS